VAFPAERGEVPGRVSGQVVTAAAGRVGEPAGRGVQLQRHRRAVFAAAQLPEPGADLVAVEVGRVGVAAGAGERDHPLKWQLGQLGRRRRLVADLPVRGVPAVLAAGGVVDGGCGYQVPVARVDGFDAG
jgi:hypothetical protein